MARRLAWANGLAAQPNVGLFAARPAAGEACFGQKYYATDQAALYECVELDNAGLATSFAWHVVDTGGGSGLTQAAWFVNDTTGLVTNDGSAAVQVTGSTVGPVPFAEWARRAIAGGGVGVGVAMVVNVASNITAMPQGTINVARLGSTLQILGASGVTSLRTGILNPVTSAAPATNVAQQGTDSIGAVWTAFVGTTHIGIRVRNTTVGARLNSTFWPAKDLAAGACRFSAPIAAIVLASGALAITLSSITATDTYAVEQLPLVTVPWTLNFVVDSYQGIVGAQEAVQISELGFANTTSRSIFESNADFGLAFYGCDMGSMILRVPAAYLVNCRSIASGTVGASWVSRYAGLNVGAYNWYGTGTIDFRFMIQTGSFNIYSNTPAATILSQVQVYDSAAAGITLYGSAQFAAGLGAREIFGASNATYGISAITPSLSTFLTDTTTGTTLTGGTAATGVAGTSKTYAQLPYIKSDIAAGSGTTFCGMIVTP